MTSRAALLLLLLSSSSVLACTASAGDEDTASSVANLGSDQAGIDVQVLQIWTAGKAFPVAPQPWQGSQASDITIHAEDPNVCTTLRTWTTQTSSSWEDREVDCTSALGKAAPFDLTQAPGPVMTPVRFHISKRLPDGQLYVDPDFCSRVETRVVVRDAALSQPSFAGIGFYTSRGDSFTPKADLQAVGHVRLKNGDDATVYRFTGLSTCISSAHNSTSGNMYQTFSFKPYAAYDGTSESGEPTRFRVWEDIRGNHAIGRSWPGSSPRVDALSFDRQDDLLAR